MTVDAPVHVLVPTIGRGADARVDIAAALLELYGGQATVLSVVEVPVDRSLSEGALLVRRRRALLRKLAQLHPDQHVRAMARPAYSLLEGIREGVAASGAELLLLDWRPGGRSNGQRALDDLIDNPPCDLAMLKKGKQIEIGSVLLPVRGGPHARLALRLAQAEAAHHNAVLTLLHIEAPRWSARRRAFERTYFDALLEQVTYEKTEQVYASADSIEHALLEYGARHDLVVMGAAARDETSAHALGRIPVTVARRLDTAVIVVKTREPLTVSSFGLATEPLTVNGERDLSEVVDRWFAENTFHSHEFRTISYLIDLKERQGRTISLALPTLNEEKTVGKIISTIKRELMDRCPLIDEFVVIDSASEDRTTEIAADLGVQVYQHANILPEYGSYQGKGEALWKSLQVTCGDIVAWIDSDITGIHPKFVYGLIGPLLTQPHLGFVKGFYRRPLNLGGERLTTGGGRVTELTARPLINLFYPELSGLVQPLAGEMAGRRDVLESVPFFTGYGVETGLLIDILEQFGLRGIAQTDLEERIHRNQSLLSLSKMAFAIVQVVVRRMGDRRRLQLLEDVNTSMKLIHYSPTELFLEVKEIEEHERPAIKTLPEYGERHSGPTAAAVTEVAEGVRA
ncbi:MAG: glucosyl-3-phosphoglycerate synthase [Chloroflexota bacterium]